MNNQTQDDYIEEQNVGLVVVEETPDHFVVVAHVYRSDLDGEV